MTDSSFASIMPRHFLVCWIFALLMLTACSSEPVHNRAQLEVRPSAQRRLPPVETAKSYGLKDHQASQHLLNADTLIQSGDAQGAQQQLDLINLAELAPEQRSKFNLLQAEMALSMGDAERAIQQLQSARPKQLANADQMTYYQSLAFAHALQGNVMQGVSARIRLGNLLQNPQQQQQNIVAILDMLSVLPPETLNTPPVMAEELNGWMQLAKIFKQREQPGFDLGGQIGAWRQAYPGHPANAEFLQSYLSAPQPNQPVATVTESATARPAASGPSIAVLLPASGNYAQAGKAIKEGLQAAHRLAASTAPQLPLKFYDSEQTDIASVYQQALSEGATQVIGPLIKEQIQTLAQDVELNIPVLALNHVENLAKANLYQFGLSPIDEAEQLALRARRDGRPSALLLVPDSSQGQRIGHYLTTAWQSQGGVLAGIHSYDPKQHNLADIINNLLSSTAVLPDGQKLPQTLLLSVNPDVARELAPQLKFHQAGDLAVYAMPNIYSGRQNPAQDAELGAITFCDIPWLFADIYSGPLSQAALQSNWQTLPDHLTRLVALGVDAYHLIGQLNQLTTTPYVGATGRLGLNNENRITRKLVCAQFKGGVPVASGFIE